MTNPEIFLRSWADALNATADLQHTITEIAAEIAANEPPLQQGWLLPYREFVMATLASLRRGSTSIILAESIHNQAIDALARLHTEARNHQK